jgi:hypothetical protein
MITQKQVDDFVDQLSQKVAKIGDDLVAHITDLKAQIAAGQDLTPTLGKLEALGNQLQAVDDVIPEKPASAPADAAPATSGPGSGAEIDAEFDKSSASDQTASAAGETQPLSAQDSSESSGS